MPEAREINQLKANWSKQVSETQLTKTHTEDKTTSLRLF